MEISNCAAVIAVDPVPDAATALRARKLDRDPGSRPSHHRPDTPDEMLRFALRWIANAVADVFSARDIGHRGPPVKREGYPSAGVFPVTGFTRWTWAQAGHRIEM